MRKIKIVVLLVRQLQHGFTKNAKVSPNLTVAHLVAVARRQKNEPGFSLYYHMIQITWHKRYIIKYNY